jgi:hypothetical protein
VVDYQVGNGGLAAFRVTLDSANQYVLAGGLSMEQRGGSINLPSQFMAVRSEVTGPLFLGGVFTYYTPRAGSSPITPFGLGPARDVDAPLRAAADLMFRHGHVLYGSDTSSKAALQLALWEILYDSFTSSGGLSLSSGRFSADASFGDSLAISLANRWANEADPNASSINLRLMPTGNQPSGMAASGLFYSPPPVPETSPWIGAFPLLFVLAFAGATTLRRYRGH